jgi:GNAT superfamily N-acetyltransferase
MGRPNLMGGMELTEATLHDYKDIAALQTESWRSAYRGILPGSYLDGPILKERETHRQTLMFSAGGKRRGVFLAKDCGTLLGFVCVLLDEEPAWGARLDNIHVRPTYKGRGTGRLLFTSAAEWVSMCEPQWPMHLFVFEANHPARRFYEAMGGKVVEQYAQKTPAGVVVLSLRFLWQKRRTIANL